MHGTNGKESADAKGQLGGKVYFILVTRKRHKSATDGCSDFNLGENFLCRQRSA